jgi:hypothetical protein
LTTEHFLTTPQEESTMTEPTRPKLNRFKYAAMLLGAMAVAAFPSVGLTAVATAEPDSGTWDLEDYESCMSGFPYNPETTTWQQIEDQKGYCCRRSGGVEDPGQEPEHCRAPSGDAQGSRQLPGNVQIPSDIATAPTVTKAPLRPIRVPSDIATAPAVSQAPA